MHELDKYVTRRVEVCDEGSGVEENETISCSAATGRKKTAGAANSVRKGYALFF